MSRVANNPITIPSGIDVKIQGQAVTVKGPKGSLNIDIHGCVEVTQDNNQLIFKQRILSKRAGGVPRSAVNALSGTSRAIVNNMINGVSKGFEKKLLLVGVGYKAAIKGNTVDLTLGFSHPVNHAIPEGITIECPSPTELVIKGVDKQKVGQVAAEIRAYRSPEPYKGKGIRYADEKVILKETKK
jgi:large subunit ribosomal protein L6